MNNLGRRGQITYFIIFFIVGVILFGVILYLRNMMVTVNSGSSAGEITSQSSSGVRSIDVYLESCIGSELEEVLDIALLQGGHLYGKDGGQSSISSVKRVDYKGHYVSYGLVADVPWIYDIPRNFNPPEEYFFSDGIDSKGFFEFDNPKSYFGSVVMPKICLIEGPNDPVSNPKAKFSCLKDMYNLGASDSLGVLQGALMRYMPSRIESCLERIPDSVSVFNPDYTNLGKIDVVLTDDGVVVVSENGITYENDGKTGSLLINYEYDYPIKQMFFLVYDLLKQESNNILFDLSSDYTNSAYYSDRYEVLLYRDFLNKKGKTGAGEYDDLLIVLDKSYKLENPAKIGDILDLGLRNANLGHSFMIPVFIQNRRPYIETVENVHFRMQVPGEWRGIPISVPFDLIVKIYDPDDDVPMILDNALYSVNGNGLKYLDDAGNYIFFSATSDVSNVFSDLDFLNIKDESAVMLDSKFDSNTHMYCSNEVPCENINPLKTTMHSINFTVRDLTGDFDYRIFNVTSQKEVIW